MAKWRRAGRAPIPPRSRRRATPTSKTILPGWTTFTKPRFSDIVGETPAPSRRGPESYQYRVKLERRGPAGPNHPPGFFRAGLRVGHVQVLPSGRQELPRASRHVGGNSRALTSILALAAASAAGPAKMPAGAPVARSLAANEIEDSTKTAAVGPGATGPRVTRAALFC